MARTLPQPHIQLPSLRDVLSNDSFRGTATPPPSASARTPMAIDSVMNSAESDDSDRSNTSEYSFSSRPVLPTYERPASISHPYSSSSHPYAYEQPRKRYSMSPSLSSAGEFRSYSQPRIAHSASPVLNALESRPHPQSQPGYSASPAVEYRPYEHRSFSVSPVMEYRQSGVPFSLNASHRSYASVDSYGYDGPVGYGARDPHRYAKDLRRATRHCSPPNGRRRRGNLPKSATDILKRWFMNHLDHPYPTEDEKQSLMREADLLMNQVANWFINARRRQLPDLVRAAELASQVTREAPAQSPSTQKATQLPTPPLLHTPPPPSVYHSQSPYSSQGPFPAFQHRPDPLRPSL